MPDEWFLRIGEKEYGPADLPTLRDWLSDGRVLRENEARPAQSQTWIRAVDIPGLFSTTEAAAPVQRDPATPGRPLPGFFRICFDSVALYIKGFFSYLGLTLLVVVPSVLSQLTAAMLDKPGALDVSLRTLLAGAFSFCMLLLTMLAWPVYIAGIQILTADLAGQGHITFFEVLNRSLKVWPRVAVLCVVVYLAFAFWTILPMVVILFIGLGGPSVLSFFLILAIGGVQAWIFGRLFVNFLFWQQCAVLEETDVAGALRESKAVARSRYDLVWFKRPMWKGVFISSLWVLFVLILALPTVLPAFREYWHVINTNQSPQAVMEAMTKMPRSQGLEQVNMAISLFEAMLRPLCSESRSLLNLPGGAFGRSGRESRGSLTSRGFEKWDETELVPPSYG